MHENIVGTSSLSQSNINSSIPAILPASSQSGTRISHSTPEGPIVLTDEEQDSYYHRHPFWEGLPAEPAEDW